MTYILIRSFKSFSINVNLSKPLSAVHEMIFCYVKRQSVNWRYVEDVFQSLIILIIVWSYFSNIRTQIRFVNGNSIPLFGIRLIMEEITAVALDLGYQKRKVVWNKLIWSEDFGCCTIEIVFLSPRWFPCRLSLIAVKRGFLIHKVAIAIYLVVLINVSEIVFSC